MKIISVHNNWKDEVLNIDLNLGNYCNYKCWYCWPGSNSGTHKFPDLEVIKKNINHLINYYKEHANKKVFDIHFCGGEPSHWPRLIEFIKFLKEEHNCLISMTSNGSKKIEWWAEAAPYFDRINLSCHHQYVEIEKYRDLCDYLYEQNVVVSVSVMMDPHAWDKCLLLVDQLKKSRRRWTIRYVEIIDPSVSYTDEQKSYIAKHRARKVNLFFFFKNNKYYRSKVRVIDDKGKSHKFSDARILLERLNNFYGWECTVGVNWINIDMSGRISGTCGQRLYGKIEHFNLYDAAFTEQFNPLIIPSVCEQRSCVCSIETVMPKRLVNNSNQKVIPIFKQL